MHPLLNTAIRAARRAGDVILRHVDRLEGLRVESKGRHDFVSEIDHLAEREILRVLRRAYPNHAILAEESGAHAGDEYQWIIDPLDGTTNFLHGYPQFAVAIALRHRTTLQQAVVFDPLRNELFSATAGAGAWLDDRRIRVSNVQVLDNALLATGFPFRQFDDLERWLHAFRWLMPRVSGVRRAGSAALDLAYVAKGRCDGFWEFGLQPWDIAAGALLVQEAGGLLSDPDDGDYLESGNLVVGNPAIQPLILDCVRSYRP